MGSNLHGVWDEARVERLRALAAAGLSASEMAAELGRVSRNAVIGAAHRNDIPIGGGRPRSTPRKPNAPRALIRRPPKLRLAPVVAAPKPVTHAALVPSAVRKAAMVRAMPAEPKSRNLRVDQISDVTCKWAHADATPWDFCGHRSFAGSSYCEHHWRRTLGRQPAAA